MNNSGLSFSDHPFILSDNCDYRTDQKEYKPLFAGSTGFNQQGDIQLITWQGVHNPPSGSSRDCRSSLYRQSHPAISHYPGSLLPYCTSSDCPAPAGSPRRGSAGTSDTMMLYFQIIVSWSALTPFLKKRPAYNRKDQICDQRSKTYVRKKVVGHVDAVVTVNQHKNTCNNKAAAIPSLTSVLRHIC